MIYYNIATVRMKVMRFFAAKIANSDDINAKNRKNPHIFLYICRFTRTFAIKHIGPDWIWQREEMVCKHAVSLQVVTLITACDNLSGENSYALAA